jgi:hypothetical protein
LRFTPARRDGPFYYRRYLVSNNFFNNIEEIISFNFLPLGTVRASRACIIYAKLVARSPFPSNTRLTMRKDRREGGPRAVPRFRQN